jgi:hypothetical protein
MRAAVERVRAEGGLEEINALRDFTPADRVHARIEIGRRRRLGRGRVGIDVMGDGSLVAYRGLLRKEPIDADGDAVYELLRRALAG